MAACTNHRTLSKSLLCGAPFSSVGRARVLCAEALQRTWVRLPAWVPLLRVTPVISSAVLSIKPLKKNLYCACPTPNRRHSGWLATKHGSKQGLTEWASGLHLTDVCSWNVQYKQNYLPSGITYPFIRWPDVGPYSKWVLMCLCLLDG